MNDEKLPPGPLVAFYGDDFTGSSSVMEVMTFAGLPAVMFVEPPTREQLSRFAGRRAIGIASVARAQSPEWMDDHLPKAFAALAELDAPIVHYKVCSTFDSSQTVGSIGRAIDIGAPIFAQRKNAAAWQPLVVAAPGIGRYQAFGNLFANLDGVIHRLDRHPVMHNHPVTPMHEADVRRHLAEQTSRPIGLVDCVAMKSAAGIAKFEAEMTAGRSIVALDVVDEETLRWVGELIWRRREGGLFAIGSQGVEYALVAYWRAAGLMPEEQAPVAAGEEDQIVAVSGSVSAVTAAQIAAAEAQGFDVVALDAAAAVDDSEWAAALEAARVRALATLSARRSPIIATARGPDDPAVSRLRAALANQTIETTAVNARIGEGLGSLLRELIDEAGLRRAAVSGGDTSGFAMRMLGVYALEALSPIAPGAPLCRAYSQTASLNGLEIALKGGQMGTERFFESVRAGRPIL